MRNVFTSRADLDAARATARLQRDRAHARLGRRWAMLKYADIRTALITDAMGAVIRGWSPLRTARAALHSPLARTSLTAVGLALAGAQRTLGKRLLVTGLSVLVGRALGDDARAGDGLISRFSAAVGRSIRAVQQRRAERAREQERES